MPHKIPGNLTPLAALCGDSPHYVMGGVSLEFEKGSYKTTATNGKILAHVTGTSESDSAGVSIIPAKPFSTALKASRGGEVEIKIEEKETTLLALDPRNGNAVSSKIPNLDGRFPNCTSILKDANNKPADASITLNVALLIPLLKAALAVTETLDKENSPITLEIRKNQPMLIRAKGKDDQEFTGLIMSLA